MYHENYFKKSINEQKIQRQVQQHIVSQWRIQDLTLGGGGAWTLSTGGGVENNWKGWGWK